MERRPGLLIKSAGEDVVIDNGWRRPDDMIPGRKPEQRKISIDSPPWLNSIKIPTQNDSATTSDQKELRVPMPDERPEFDFPLVPPDWQPEPEKPPGSYVIEIKI
jgi:hypothetical protein